MKTFLTAFGLIFLAELGDKTQLCALTLAADSKNPWAVALGGSLAMAVLTYAGCFIGGAIAHVVPPHVIKKVAGVLFVLFGVLIFFDIKLPWS